MLLFAVITFNFLTQTLQKEFDDALYNYAVDVLDGIALSPRGSLTFEESQLDRQKIYPFSLGTALIQITNRQGLVASQLGDFGAFALPLDRKAFQLEQDGEVSYLTIYDVSGLISKEAETYRMISFPIDNTPIPQLILQVAAPMTLLENQLQNRKLAFQFGIPMVLLIATIAGLFLSDRALAPIRKMIDQAGNISVDALSNRLPIPPVKDEIRDLSVTLNSMLDRIQKAFESQERFVADASHQLLTPLAVMKGQIERSISENPQGSEIFKGLLQEVDHLSRLVQDMLVLARIDAGRDSLHLQEVALDEVIFEALRRVEKLRAESEKRIQVQLSESLKQSAIFWGDMDLLVHLVFNLLENALKYSKGTEAIRLQLQQTEKYLELSVENPSDWIAEEDLATIFERFHRGSATAHRQRGFGLGLSIVQKIAQVHGGEMSVLNSTREDGLQVVVFQLKLPISVA